jgi:hypothetical protein
MTRANANALFKGLKSKPSFTNVITIRPGDPEDSMLMDARKILRASIRASFAHFRPSLLTEEMRGSLFERRDYQFQAAAKAMTSVDVRFLTQGSHAYGTLNRPAHPPHQEIDLDDGVYVPMPFVGGRPLFSSEGLFRVVEGAMRPVVQANGWSFKRKDTCIRVSLIGKGGHIDLPLFAVEESDFRNLSAIYEQQTGLTFKTTKARLNETLDTSARNIRLREGRILLADREQDWRPSDPKAIHDWFVDQVKRFGRVLRRQCRYMKAWRDETWSSCSISSLALMVACVDAFAGLNSQPAEDRDDLMFLHVASTLADKFSSGGIAWRPGESSLDGSWSPEERQEYVQKVTHLATEIDAALNGTYNSHIVVNHLRAAFGSRFPEAPESVTVNAASQTAAVLQNKPATVSMPLVGSSVSA